MNYEIPEFRDSNESSSSMSEGPVNNSKSQQSSLKYSKKSSKKSSKKVSDQKVIKFNNYLITVLTLSVIIGKLYHMLYKEQNRVQQLSQNNTQLEEKLKKLEKVNEGLVNNITSETKGHINTRGSLSNAQNQLEGLKSELSKTKGELAKMKAQLDALKSNGKSQVGAKVANSGKSAKPTSPTSSTTSKVIGNPAISQKERESYTNPKNKEYKKEFSKSYYKSLNKLQTSSKSKSSYRSNYRSSRSISSSSSLSNPFSSVMKSLNKLSSSLKSKPTPIGRSKKDDSSLKNFQGDNSKLVGGWGEP